MVLAAPASPVTSEGGEEFLCLHVSLCIFDVRQKVPAKITAGGGRLGSRGKSAVASVEVNLEEKKVDELFGWTSFADARVVRSGQN